MLHQGEVCFMQGEILHRIQNDSYYFCLFYKTERIMHRMILVLKSIGRKQNYKQMLDPKRVLLINVLKESDRKKKKINYEDMIENYTSFSTNY